MPMHTFNISMAERCALAIAAVALLLTALGVAEALEYRRALLASEPWRLITGHLVHINWAHAVINVLALLIVARLFSPDLTVLRQMTVLLTAGFVISAGLTLGRPDIAWYRGLSGVLHALFFAGATTWLLRTQPRSVGALWLPAALFFGGWIKVALEQPTGNVLPPRTARHGRSHPGTAAPSAERCRPSLCRDGPPARKRRAPSSSSCSQLASARRRRCSLLRRPL
jgi:rhomboid family GlyGly-CTERM serine protease